MPVTDADQQQIVGLLVRDLHATVGVGHDHIAESNAVHVREFVDDLPDYIEKVVDDTQQDIHDQFIDTDWPKCPRHEHPLWYRDGAWWCERDGVCVARLGELRAPGPER